MQDTDALPDNVLLFIDGHDAVGKTTMIRELLALATIPSKGVKNKFDGYFLAERDSIDSTLLSLVVNSELYGSTYRTFAALTMHGRKLTMARAAMRDHDKARATCPEMKPMLAVIDRSAITTLAYQGELESADVSAIQAFMRTDVRDTANAVRIISVTLTADYSLCHNRLVARSSGKPQLALTERQHNHLDFAFDLSARRCQDWCTRDNDRTKVKKERFALHSMRVTESMTPADIASAVLKLIN